MGARSVTLTLVLAVFCGLLVMESGGTNNSLDADGNIVWGDSPADKPYITTDYEVDDKGLDPYYALAVSYIGSSLPAEIPVACKIPADYFGDWYWMNDAGSDEVTIVNLNQWGYLDCVDIKTHPNTFSNLEGTNATMLMQQRQDEDAEGLPCYVCVDVLYRTPNILQVRRGTCLTVNNGIENMCDGYTALPWVDQVNTYFRQTLKTVNCNTTFEGMYQFTYEVSWGEGGICDNPDSQIQAYQDPFSAYVDNEVFFMRYEKCPGVQTSYSQKIRYHCMGSWFTNFWSGHTGHTGHTFAAIADTKEADRREKFKCLMMLENQKSADNNIRWVMSRFARCKTLYEAPVRLVLRRTADCSLTGEGDCDLKINVTPEKLACCTSWLHCRTTEDTCRGWDYQGRPINNQLRCCPGLEGQGFIVSSKFCICREGTAEEYSAHNGSSNHHVTSPTEAASSEYDFTTMDNDNSTMDNDNTGGADALVPPALLLLLCSVFALLLRCQ